MADIKKIAEVLNNMVKLADDMDKDGLHDISDGLDKIADRIVEKIAGEKIDYKDWEIQNSSLKENDWALNVSRGEEEEGTNPILVKIQDGIMTVSHDGKLYKSGIQFKSQYFYSDRFKNSIARAFRGLQTGKVSFTQVEEMYDLQKISDDKSTKPDAAPEVETGM